MTRKIYNFIALSYLLLSLISCTSKENSNTFFGGKIINPKTKFVVLYSNDKVIDTLLLDSRNKFLGTYDNLEEGLYYFEHGNENQYLYLEPKDSLMLRLNTWDFDESIVFAGRGAERNNILIDIFLEDESERKLFYQLNRLAPTAYISKIDSVIDSRLITYNEYIKRHPNETTKYLEILKTSLTYPIYSRAERYPINHIYSSRKSDFPKINSSFYAYRKTIDYNNNSLMYYTPYARYITNYLYNVTYAMGHKPMKEEFSSEFTVDLLHTINTEISSRDSKNAFLKRTVLDHFYRKSSCDVNEKAFDVFFDLSSNKEDQILVKNILEDNKIILKGDEIKGFTISDFTNQGINIEDFTINKNSVLLFWSKEYMSTSFIGSRIPFLQKKYPLLNFAIIEIDGDNTNRIKNIDIKNQYFINSKTLKNNFLSSKMNRTILVNKNGIVENGYAAISSGNIYKQLKELSKIN
ncbi:hypothetical protein CW731_03815 [Polaribacter sp. ALD11]|uniref:hypothetical protein n=1 Tax=Polaribacter sp. ALD11 TaxID=2058137 RepID=UPI000C315058|nr:hypothetical protein [Polaribacter sp. ALD11]AUC84475.1 hypothetical protein CW731_03815 [Polaribacter sp. ALD11]